MPLEFALSDELKSIIKKLEQKDKTTARALQNKINQIIELDGKTVEHFKNLRHGLSDYKRVHINKSFVLLFEYDKKEKQVLFHTLKHHDEAYK